MFEVCENVLKIVRIYYNYMTSIPRTMGLCWSYKCKHAILYTFLFTITVENHGVKLKIMSRTKVNEL